MGVNRRKNTCVTFAAPGTVSEFGDLSYGDKVTVDAWHERHRMTIRDPSGDERVVTDRLVTDCEIPYGSAVWMEKDDLKKPAPKRAEVVKFGKTFRGQEVFETWL
jgi:hypothetical protein